MALSPRMRRIVKRANPRMVRFAGRVPPFAVLHHVGRTSGTGYRTPVVAFAAQQSAADEGGTRALLDGLVCTPLPWGADTDWCRTVLAAGSYRLTRGRREYVVDELRVIPADDAVPLVPFMGRAAKVLRFQRWIVGRLHPAPPPPTP